MQITTAAFLLFAAMGAVATPIEPQPDSIDVRDNPVARFEHSGVSSRLRPVPGLLLTSLFIDRNAPKLQTNASTRLAEGLVL
jgi:hypothetical protein